MLRAGSSRDRHRAGPDVPFRPRGGADRAGAGAFYVAGPTVVSRVLSPTVVAGAALGAERREAWPGGAGQAARVMDKAWPPRGGAGRLRRVRSREKCLVEFLSVQSRPIRVAE